MKSKHLIILAGAVAVLASCTTRTVIYERKPATVYRSSPSPAALPGQAYRLPEPGAPSSFRAASGDN